MRHDIDIGGRLEEIEFTARRRHRIAPPVKRQIARNGDDFVAAVGALVGAGGIKEKLAVVEILAGGHAGQERAAQEDKKT